MPAAHGCVGTFAYISLAPSPGQLGAWITYVIDAPEVPSRTEWAFIAVDDTTSYTGLAAESTRAQAGSVVGLPYSSCERHWSVSIFDVLDD